MIIFLKIALNGVIWKRFPKDVFVGRSTLEMGVTSAVKSFNDRQSGKSNGKS